MSNYDSNSSTQLDNNENENNKSYGHQVIGNRISLDNNKISLIDQNQIVRSVSNEKKKRQLPVLPSAPSASVFTLTDKQLNQKTRHLPTEPINNNQFLHSNEANLLAHSNTDSKPKKENVEDWLNKSFERSSIIESNINQNTQIVNYYNNNDEDNTISSKLKQSNEIRKMKSLPQPSILRSTNKNEGFNTKKMLKKTVH
jgi:hypothetical protein